ncbi:Dus1l [Acrasis kona]|uniref:Dus1l n=1 Tax=Acrasis kona TaxID=1008807 RepID=A0AAW2Z9W1_9EUKA
MSEESKGCKVSGYEFYRSIGSPKYILAPMVDQSELAFRLLCKNHGTQLTYTPMFHSRVWVDHKEYRNRHWQVVAGEGPMFVQFCGNEPETVLEATRLCMELPHARDIVAAFDLNLGCPQRIAQRGRYGSYLMEEQDVIRRIVETMHRESEVPITCKVRIFPDVQHTLKYAEMLRDAGCQLLTVHGRTREQRGVKQGLADWDQIKMVREHIKDIPVIANGNIQTFEDVTKCMEYTGVDGIMSAVGLLENPALFSNQDDYDRAELALEYLDLTDRPNHNPPNVSYTKSHIFKVMLKEWMCFPDLRDAVQYSGTKEEMRKIIKEADSRKKERPDDWRTFYLNNFKETCQQRRQAKSSRKRKHNQQDTSDGNVEEQNTPTKIDKRDGSLVDGNVEQQTNE